MVFDTKGYFKSLNIRGVIQLTALGWQSRYDGDILPQCLHTQKYTKQLVRTEEDKNQHFVQLIAPTENKEKKWTKEIKSEYFITFQAWNKHHKRKNLDGQKN